MAYVSVPWLHLGRRTTLLTADGGPQVADEPTPGGSDSGLPPLTAGPVDEPGLDEGWSGLLTDPTILIGGGVGAVAKGVASKAPAVARTAWASIRGLFVRGVVRGYPYTADDLVRAAMEPINKEGLSKAARAWDKHAIGQRPSGTFPPLTGGIEARNAGARRIVESILRNPRSTPTRTPNGGVRIRAPTGHGLRFGKDGSFIGLLD